MMKGEALVEKGANSDEEESIVVSVRVRPLNEKELARNEECDWECISYNTVAIKNNLSERITFPTAYTFDRVFGFDCTTKQVYDEGAKEVILSVLKGINSTLFAYGQTSSGKTYTMNGVTKYAIADVYDYIEMHKEREFVLKFSAMEIYNEIVRDLLSADGTPLRLLDDPEKGTVVEKLTEEILRDQSHLKELLSICEGGSGYIASYLIKLLLQRGYTVKTSVRNINDSKKTQHLLLLDGAKERLHLFEADLLKEGSFDSVVDGCECVFHTASPAIITTTNPQVELIDPAVKGTLNVLRSCVKVPSLKRVVFTSSMSAVSFNGRPLTPDVMIDETWFSDPILCEKLKIWYMLSKTLAEEAAWKFAEENGINLVSINPGFAIGPMLPPTLNVTMEFVRNTINAQTFPNAVHRFVHIRDVALAHIRAFEVANANGRYCVVGHVVHVSEVLNILQRLYPTLTIPEKCEDDKPFPPLYQISKEKARNLGIEFTSLEVILRDTIESLKDKGFLNI